MIILGIDPGNYSTGFSFLKIDDGNAELIFSGTIKSKKKPENLKKIFEELNTLIENYLPKEIALESSFYGKNPQSLIRLGEVRGIILLLSAVKNLPVFEYTPQQVKNSITGYGWASKEQVLTMVEKIFNKNI
ncbi:MAG: crossover junction endodeoxyribonuclease RuvC, partial [Aquificota bacterium]